MEIRAFLNADGSAVASFGEPGAMAGFEVEWHAAELRLTAKDGSLVRSVTTTLGGGTVVDGPSPAPAAQASETVGGEHPAEAEAHGDSVPGGTVEVHADSVAGFAGFSQHADEVKP